MENEKKEIGRKEQETDAIMKAHKSIAALAEYMFGDEVFKDSPGTDGVDDIVTVLGRAEESAPQRWNCRMACRQRFLRRADWSP